MYEIKRQQFLEDLECCHSDELDIVGLLARAKDLQDKCTKEEFNTLCSYLTLPNLRDHPDFKHWSVEQGRYECFEKILALLKTVIYTIPLTLQVYLVEPTSNKLPEGRLLALMRQALQFQCVVQTTVSTSKRGIGILQVS